MGLFDKLFGTRSQREIKKIQPLVDQILALEDSYKALSEEELRGKTAQFKQRLAEGENLDDLLPEAFATVREAADRVLGLRPYPVQLMGGIILHQGRIAEMKTGEGKTLVAILPSYLNALTGEGVHVVTVNDYLAKYQSEWMGKVYRYLGLTIGLVIPGMTPAQRRQAYAADITYCTNNELGFDYLRDNMAIYKQELVQRGHAFAIVDEVDSILIDEARTPLIISGKGEDSSQLYQRADQFVATLRRQVFAKTDEKEVQDDYDCDYFVDEKARTVSLTAKGIEKAEKFFGVEDPIIPLLNQKWALPVVVLIAVWKGIGLNFLTYLGALQNVDKSQVEAAEIDGANKWQQIKNVVIPAVAPTTFFLTISSIITSLQNFTVIQSLTDGGPGQATTVMSLSIVNTAFVKYETSYASAQALVMFGIVMIITLIQWRGQKKWADQ